jgi:hypothetical protein
MMAEGVPNFLQLKAVTAWPLWSPTQLIFHSHFCDDRYFHQLDAAFELEINFLIIICSNRNVRMSDLKLETVS